MTPTQIRIRAITDSHKRNVIENLAVSLNDGSDLALDYIVGNRGYFEMYAEDGNSYVIINIDDEYHAFVLANYAFSTGKKGYGYTTIHHISDNLNEAYSSIINVMKTDNELKD